jgi:hypothetical protein
MTDYICEKCQKSFANNSNLQRHRKSSNCISGSKNKKIINFTCNKCAKKFTRKDSLKKHINMKRCKKNVTKTNIDKSKDVAVNNANNGIAMNKSSITVNLLLLNFGKDGVKTLTVEEMSKMLKSDRNLFESIISTINFNPDKPQHHNVYYPDMKSTYGVVYENKKWITKKIDEILNLLLDAKTEDFNEILNEMGDFLDKKTRQKIKETIDNADYSKPNYRKKLISYLKPILHNNKDMIIKTRKMNELDN